MERRDVIVLRGGMTAGWPFVQRAQPPTLSGRRFYQWCFGDGSLAFADAFRKGLNEAGFVEGPGRQRRMPLVRQSL
jgi:hypothetical protein